MKQPEALRLAAQLEDTESARLHLLSYAAAELRRLHAENEALHAAIKQAEGESEMTTLREAAQRALEALELNNSEWKSLADSGDAGYWRAEDQDYYKQTSEAIAALRAALAEQDDDLTAAWVAGAAEARADIAKAEGEES